MTRITIVTVVYNEAVAISATIQSVQAQKNHPIQYIVIDGGSTDGTVDVLRRYNDSISYWVSEKDHGIYDAMNKGWRQAHPDSFVMYLGAGDQIISLPTCDQDFEGVDVVYGRVKQERCTFVPKVDYRLRMVNTLHHQGMLVRHAVHPNPPFDIRLRAYADFDFNQRLYKHGVRFAYSERLLASAMAGGLSSRHFVRESLFIINKNFGPFWAAMAVSYFVAYYTTRPGFANISLKNTVRRTPAPNLQSIGDW